MIKNLSDLKILMRQGAFRCGVFLGAWDLSPRLVLDQRTFKRDFKTTEPTEETLFSQKEFPLKDMPEQANFFVM
jgi:hypothetical protein